MISIIIPCFNTGSFLEEAINSVFDCVKEEFEIIIVNDGSTDNETLSAIKNISNPKIKVINQENKGLATSRNVGVENSKGNFLLFLDSDNKVLPGYSKLALKAFIDDPNLGVVYGKPLFFGDIETPLRFKAMPFDFDHLLRGNFIDACAFVRKDAFISVGGFSVDSKLQGWDDWELWIKLALKSWSFQFIDIECFEYRVRKDSMIGSASKRKKNDMLQYIGNKYGYLFHRKYRQYHRTVNELQKNPFQVFIKVIYFKYILRKPFI